MKLSQPHLPALLAVVSVTFLAACSVALVDHAPPDKVLVCHKGKKTLSIARAALDAHLGHGDRRGPCR